VFADLLLVVPSAYESLYLDGSLISYIYLPLACADQSVGRHKSAAKHYGHQVPLVHAVKVFDVTSRLGDAP